VNISHFGMLNIFPVSFCYTQGELLSLLFWFTGLVRCSVCSEYLQDMN
jgi:hypothetical protein